MTATEQVVLDAFRDYRVQPGQMLCFHGPWLEKHEPTLRRMVEQKLVVKEQFAAGYSLTDAGYRAMRRPRTAGSSQGPAL